MKFRIILDVLFNEEPMKEFKSYRERAWPNGIDYIKAVFLGAKIPHVGNGLMKIFSQNYRNDAFIPQSIMVEELPINSIKEAGIVETCGNGHDFIKLPDHPKRDGLARCPHCLAIGWDKMKAEIDQRKKF